MGLDHIILGEDNKVEKVVVKGVEYGTKELYQEFWPSVYGFLLAKTKNAENAEDLAQDTFGKIFNNMHRFNPGNFTGWMLRIASNTFINHYRSRKNKPRLYTSLDEGERVYVDEKVINPESAALYKDLIGKCESVFDKVINRPQWRQIYLMSEVQGLKYPEIAEELGIPEGTVMSSMFRIRRVMAPYLEVFKFSED